MKNKEQKFNPDKYYHRELRKANTAPATAIKHTQQYIKKYYQGTVAVNDLLSRYKEVEHIKDYYVLLSAMFIGMISGIFGNLLLDSAEIANAGGVINWILFAIIVIIITLAIVFIPKHLKFKKSNYNMLIVPYEQQIIKKKLLDDYQISDNPK